jgi:hypothetical protein
VTTTTDVAVRPRAGGGIRLRVTTPAGDTLEIEMSAARATEFRNAVESATKSTVHTNHI